MTKIVIKLICIMKWFLSYETHFEKIAVEFVECDALTS